MKRFYLSIIGVALVAMLFATTASAQPAKHAAAGQGDGTGEQPQRSCRRSRRTSSRAAAGTSA